MSSDLERSMEERGGRIARALALLERELKSLPERPFPGEATVSALERGRGLLRQAYYETRIALENPLTTRESRDELGDQVERALVHVSQAYGLCLGVRWGDLLTERSALFEFNPKERRGLFDGLSGRIRTRAEQFELDELASAVLRRRELDGADGEHDPGEGK